MKNTAKTFIQMKQDGQRISEITAYDFTTAAIMEAAGINAILVGDSLGMTMLGYENTLPVTMDDMVHHTAAVSRACSDTLVIADMPFMSYQTGARDALINAGRLVQQGGANAVKLEGGAAVCDQIKAIVDAGIPVQAHVGMTPQSANVFGGFKVQGKGEQAARQLLQDAFDAQEAGAFSVVLECVPPKLAALISRKLAIPTIGIGAGAGCDGQVLVYQDMLGMTQGFTPRFAKKFADVGAVMRQGVEAYIQEVQEGSFPAPEHTFAKSDCSDDYLAQLEAEF